MIWLSDNGATVRSTATDEIHQGDNGPFRGELGDAEVPGDRPIDGVDQGDWLLGNQEDSNREHLLSFVGDRLVAVRWRQFRIYPVEFLNSNTNPSIGGYLGSTRELAAGRRRRARRNCRAKPPKP